MPGYKPIIFSPQAEEDLRTLLQFTHLKWGREQRERYRKSLRSGIDHLARYPLSGKWRPEYGDQMRSHPVGVHVIFYTPTAQGISVVRIIHQRRDQDAVSQ